MAKQKKDPVVASLESGGSGVIKPEQTQTEPLTRPKTAPSAPNTPTVKAAPHQTVTFNKDKTVNVNGKNYSAEAYKSFLSTQTGEGSSSPSHNGELMALLKGQQQTEQNIENPAVSQAAIDANLADISGVPQLTPEEIAQDTAGDTAANLGLNAKAILEGATKSGSFGAAGGAVAGSVIPGVGNLAGGVVGGVAGAVFGGLSAYFSKVATDKAQSAREAKGTGNRAIKGFTVARNLANQGRPEEAKQIFATQKRNLYISQAQLKKLTDTATGRQLSQAMDELGTVNNYIDNYLEVDELTFAIALANPDPNKIVAVIEDPIEQSS